MKWIMYHCGSEKENVWIGFGEELEHAELSEEEIMARVDSSDSFEEAYWELCDEFEPGIEKAKALLEKGSFQTIREALKNVFGHFKVCYELCDDADEPRYSDFENMTELNCDVDDRMYDLIEQTI